MSKKSITVRSGLRAGRDKNVQAPPDPVKTMPPPLPPYQS
jgi:hypothetical protein